MNENAAVIWSLKISMIIERALQIRKGYHCFVITLILEIDKNESTRKIYLKDLNASTLIKILSHLIDLKRLIHCF